MQKEWWNSKLIIMVAVNNKTRYWCILGYHPLEHTSWKENGKSLSLSEFWYFFIRNDSFSTWRNNMTRWLRSPGGAASMWPIMQCTTRYHLCGIPPKSITRVWSRKEHWMDLVKGQPSEYKPCTVQLLRTQKIRKRLRKYSRLEENNMMDQRSTFSWRGYNQ